MVMAGPLQARSRDEPHGNPSEPATDEARDGCEGDEALEEVANVKMVAVKGDAAALVELEEGQKPEREVKERVRSGR